MIVFKILIALDGFLLYHFFIIFIFNLVKFSEDLLKRWHSMIRKVFKSVLENGLTVLTLPFKLIPKVSIQLWYNVGSKDEKSGQKGIAHLIEHMIFKGTATLSECDINLITHKLSGYCNAFTSYDYTGYLFDFPTQHWHEALPIMADCMRNCTFKQEFLNSELKAVIQELKMYKDNYTASLIENLISTTFQDHPYHHPIIGYKQDLWSLTRDSLINFYNHHYIPNNATLVVVGDVDHEQVLELAKRNFGHIKPNWNYKKEEFYHSPDLKSYQVKLYRDVKQSNVIMSWTIPGLSNKKSYLFDIASRVIGAGKGSSLYKKFVNEYELVTELESFVDELFEYGLFNIYFKPKNTEDIDKIINLINKELINIIDTLEDSDINRAVKKTETDYLSLIENNSNQAYEIAKYFLATGDEQYFSNYTLYKKDNLKQEVKEFISQYLIPNISNTGYILPIKEKDKDYWLKIQEISDKEDNRILSNIKRTAEIEEGKCVYSIQVKPPKVFSYPKSQSFNISNGLKLLYYNNPVLPKVDLILDFKSKYYYDPKDLQGLSTFTSLMIEEGTKNYTANQLADFLESYGMTLYSNSGYLGLSALSNDLTKGFEVLKDLLTQATFNQNSIVKVKEQLLAEINDYWDQPMKFVTQIAKQEIYKEHPYAKNVLGTSESIKKITREDLLNYYKTFLSPIGSKLALVGNLSHYDIHENIESIFNNWKGPEVKNLIYPNIVPVKHKEINYPIMRDQTVLCYAGLSVRRTDSDYDKLLIFDQIFTGGVLGSMSSRLFDLREKTGLFYTIGGSLIYNVDLEPGLILIKTIVSNDRLKDAEKSIEEVINTAIDSLSQEELTAAKNAIINSLVDNFSTNYKIAYSSLFIDNYGFSKDYFDHRAQQILSITLENVKEVVKKYLSIEQMIKIRAGRV